MSKRKAGKDSVKFNETNERVRHFEEAEKLASRIMHQHYCEHDAEGITALFSSEFTWLGPGEEECMAGRDACAEHFLKFRGAIPKCNIWDEKYEVTSPAEGIYIVMGRMWIATDPSSGMYLKVHQRVTFVFQDTEEGLRCSHIHCSNPYQEMMGGEHFPEKIGRQSYEYVQERLELLEQETRQQNRQLEVIMSSIAGGLKISNDDDTYSYAFVSREAAALFGYTVEEFMEATGGNAVGNVYPPDLPKALSDCEEAFRDGGLTYSTRYRVRCKDGSLKWIIDSGKKAQDAEGNWMVNSLYLDVTRAEEDAEQLRKQAELLASIYDTVPCGIIRFVNSREDHYPLISLNRAELSIMGYETMEEGRNNWCEGVLGTMVKEDRAALQETYRKLKKTGDRYDGEYRVHGKDGSQHWIEATSMVVGYTSDGKPVLQRTVVDVTQRKALQQRLNREQDMYRVAMEASAAVMFEYLMDTDTFISYEPRTGQGIFRNELKNYSRLLFEQPIVHPDDVPMVIDNICKGRTEVFEVRCSTPEGEPGQYLWHRVNSRLMLEEGRPSRVVGALHNIHSMKSKLSENSERLYMSQSALNAINGVYVSIFYINLQEDSYYAVRLPEASESAALPRAGSYTGELYGFMLKDVDPLDLELVADICSRDWLLGKLTGENEHIEVEFRQNRSAVWLRMELHLVALKGGKPQTVILALRNISAEKQRELEYYKEEKKAKHALEEAYASLNQANQAKSDFLSRMSHDIRTPMNAIMGMTAIAEKSLGDDEKIGDCLAKISLSSSHLLELINEVLDMSKIESGNVSLNEEMFRWEDLMEEVSQIIRPDLDKKGQHYRASFKKTEHGSVYGDPVRVRQILLNLLSNAVKYTGEGGHISICLEEKLSSESGIGCFEIIVEDDGIGMSPDFLEKLFLPFERAADTRVSQTQGTGLGLAITKNLVQMMNGTIRAESELNRGTQFVVTIYLKLVQTEGDFCLKGSHGEKKAETQEKFKPGICVLIAEDNELNREIAKELLELFGLCTTSVENGREAVERFRKDPPGSYGLILMDIQMPVLDGYGAAREIRMLAETGERPDAAEIPIIALTANAFADDVYRAKQAGMNEHVKKPLETGRLLETLHRWLDA